MCPCSYVRLKVEPQMVLPPVSLMYKLKGLLSRQQASARASYRVKETIMTDCQGFKIIFGTDSD